MMGRTVTIKVRFADFTTITRSRTLRDPTDVSRDIYATARLLFDGLGLQRARVAALSLRVEDLMPAGLSSHQLTLDRRAANARRVEPVVDRIAARWPGSVGPAALAHLPRRAS